MGHSVDEFFVALDQDSAQGKKLPNWWVLCSTQLQNVPDTLLIVGAEKCILKLVFIDFDSFFSPIYLFYSCTVVYIRLTGPSRRVIDILKFSCVTWRCVFKSWSAILSI